ncbi:MAG: hypothetical protein JWM68_4202 [Verrucomicrobiales bacterium]|nr:hypothetical protein [Verrucomicrobiales bacterium]
MTKEYQQLTDEQVSVRAYYLWERDGRPQGHDQDYWLRAKEELICENSRSTSPGKTPAITSAEPKNVVKKKTSRTPAFA